jgi:antitoxin VapB
MNPLPTRIFMNGNSQAVRIPAELRLDTNRVQIFRNEQGDLVIHPLRPERGAALLEALQGFDEEFIAALEADREAPLPLQDRELL